MSPLMAEWYTFCRIGSVNRITGIHSKHVWVKLSVNSRLMETLSPTRQQFLYSHGRDKAEPESRSFSPSTALGTASLGIRNRDSPDLSSAILVSSLEMV